MKNTHYYLTPFCSKEVSKILASPCWKVSNINLCVFKEMYKSFSSNVYKKAIFF